MTSLSRLVDACRRYRRAIAANRSSTAAGDLRLLQILDRIEHRQPGVGLRFWAPPLWLEVTMEGPDSDRWPVVSDDASWDWQSEGSCDIERLLESGIGDPELLDTIATYTLENLILNAVHEIGEWFRLDGVRVTPAHETSASAGCQGNGAVRIEVLFDPERRGRQVARTPQPAAVDRLVIDRLSDAAAAARFTYLPGWAISYEAAGPVVHDGDRGGTGAVPLSEWSPMTLAATDVGSTRAIDLLARDVHVALVAREADRICRAFHVDGLQRWSLRSATTMDSGESSIAVQLVMASMTPEMDAEAKPIVASPMP